MEESKNYCVIAIWLLAFIIRTYSTCSRRLKAAWRSENKWSVLTRFCRAHGLNISSCVVYVFAYMDNSHYKVYSWLNLDTHSLKMETRGITVLSNLQFYLCSIDGNAELLNSHVFKVPLLLRTLDCSSAIIWLTIWWNSNDLSYRRPKSFYLVVIVCAAVFWRELDFLPNGALHYDIVKIQLGLVRHCML